MTLKVGDYVKIQPLSEEQKQNYPTGWIYYEEDHNDNMDMYIGTITKVKSIMGYNSYSLECDEGTYEWSDVNLTLINPSKMELF